MTEERSRTDLDSRTDAELRADWVAANYQPSLAPRHPDDRESGAWWVPFLTTLALTLLAPIAFGLAGLSVMATDSCGPDDCSPQLMDTLDAIFVLLPIGGLVSLVSLVICWALPRRVRYVVRRRWVAMLAIAPQLLIILMVMGLPEG